MHPGTQPAKKQKEINEKRINKQQPMWIEERVCSFRKQAPSNIPVTIALAFSSALL
jgi:hypothetical protein